MNRYLYITRHSVVSPSRDSQWRDEIPAAMKRRDARIWQMAYAAARKVAAPFDPHPVRSVITATALGALEETRLFLDGAFTDGLGSPRNFIASVHNSMAGRIALGLGIHGPNLTLCDSHNSFASAIVCADLLKSQDFPALICVIDERVPLLDEIRPHLPGRCRQFLSQSWEEAAVAFVVTDRPSEGSVRIRAAGPSPANRRDPAEVCREMTERMVPGFAGRLLFEESSTSFVQPALSAAQAMTQNSGHCVIGSYSPVSGACAIVEILPAT